MKKLFNIKRIELFRILAKHDIQLQQVGSLFASGFMTQEQADAVNREFPGTVFPRN